MILAGKDNFLPYERFDQSPLWEVHRDYFRTVGIKAWQKGHIPYSGISNFTEAYKKARLLVSNLNISKPPGLIKVLEVGAGYGEFAKNFLSALQEICRVENLDYYSRLEYHLSDFSQTTLDELKSSGRLDEFQDRIHYLVFDALDKYSALEKSSYDILFANYLLDQFPARIFAQTNRGYLEKYISIEDPQTYKEKQDRANFGFGKSRWIKSLKKLVEFRAVDLEKEIPLADLEILENCFRQDKSSTVVYSYGSLAAVKNFMQLIKPTGIIVCSDFNAATKPGVDQFEPCYYGNSLAQAVNFEFIYKYFSQAGSLSEARKLDHLQQAKLGHQIALIYEDPIKPLHTLILTRPDFPHPLELGEIYQAVYHQNWFIRLLYRFLVELQLGCYILAVFIISFIIWSLVTDAF